ncbi:MAG TPA: hypothetical protein VNZ02_08700 [Steroidobacteraceae bacterium]|jgi:hypothetical protein|nr:hypothetical protein [Steroidobacteraceae bacterium]
MNTAIKAVGLTILYGVMALGHAQSPPAAPPNATPADVPAGEASVKGPAAPAPAPPKAAKPSKATALSDAGEPRANTSGAAATGAGSAAGRLAAAGQKKGPDATDKLELGTATVTGDREQPKVMYIVPWKKSDIGDLAGKPMNSLVDEILAPVDRDVFKREVLYYKAVQADSAQNGAPSRPSQGEK